MSITYEVTVVKNGTQIWRFKDKLHRVDGPAIICADGTQYWWLNGKLHRIDGPAIIYANGNQEWFLDNKRHRVDGPAVNWVDEQWFLEQWWLDGVEMSQEEHARRTAPTKELTKRLSQEKSK